MTIVFYMSSVVAIISTILVLKQVNAVHALLYLIVSLLSVALVLFTLGAPFIAALEVIIYAGAIMVLFVFVVMMLNLGTQAAKDESRLLAPEIWVGPAILALILLAEMVYIFFSTGGRYPVMVVGPAQVGALLLGPYLLGVELSSILLLSGLVGAFHLGRGTNKTLTTAAPSAGQADSPSGGRRHKHSPPLTEQDAGDREQET
jgi:NADH-quinone oxidoreductase subunit J